MKVYIIFFFLVSTILLSGCSLKEGTEKLYRQENVLQIEILLPTEMEVDRNYKFQAFFSQQDSETPDIENVTFTIWKNGKKNDEEILPKNEGNGTYTINTMFEEEGLYFVKVKANTRDSRVMPTKQFSVGSLSEEDIHSLPKQDTEQHHEGHH